MSLGYYRFYNQDLIKHLISLIPLKDNRGRPLTESDRFDLGMYFLQDQIFSISDIYLALAHIQGIFLRKGNRGFVFNQLILYFFISLKKLGYDPLTLLFLALKNALPVAGLRKKYYGRRVIYIPYNLKISSSIFLLVKWLKASTNSASLSVPQEHSKFKLSSFFIFLILEAAYKRGSLINYRNQFYKELKNYEMNINKKNVKKKK